MKITARWPEALIILGMVGFVVSLVSCAALSEITPASEATLERQAQMQIDYSNAAIQEAADGNTTGSLVMSLGSILSMLVGSAALSRRRRKSPGNDIATLERVERGTALRNAGVGTPPTKL